MLLCVKTKRGARMETVENTQPNTANLERRHSHRQRIYKSAQLMPEGKNLVFDCLARDINEAGGRIRIPSPHTLPSTVSFAIGKDAAPRDARIIWCRGDEAGLQFIPT